MARRAGTAQAASATIANNAITLAKTRGSSGRTPYISVATTFCTDAAPTIPKIKPITTSSNPSRRTSLRMPARVLPSATRIPISRVRWATKYASTP